MNETEVAAGIAAGLIPSPQHFGNSVLVAIRISGTGSAVRPSIGETVWRDPAAWLSEEALARVAGLPVILDHPQSSALNTDEFASRSVGAILLPYVADRAGIQNTEGPDLWGIARLFVDDEMLEQISDRSTSPGVIFTSADGNQKITLPDGTECLVESSPTLIDHVAIVLSGDGAGVWDKGLPNSGLRFDNAKETNVTEEEMAMDRARKDAAENVDKMLTGLDSVSKMCDAISKRLDAIEKRGDGKSRKDSEGDETDGEKEEREAAERADAARKDLTGHRADSMKAIERDVTLADIQARADAVSTAWGQRAPMPMQGESPLRYRIRLARGFQRHSVFKDADLSVIAADNAAFATIENQIYTDSMAASRTPETLGDELVKRTRVDAESGHRVTEFFGNSTFIKGLKRPSLRATAFLTPAHRAQ